MKTKLSGALPIIAMVALNTIILSGCIGPGQGSDRFSAYYTNYGGGDEISGGYADVVVRFPDGKAFVFSRETSYLPFLDFGGKKWPVEEIIPREGDGEGLRKDQHNMYSYVRIIRNSDEEVLVHWRYVPDFSNTGFTGVVHEYFSINPDGRVQRIIQPGKDNLEDFNDPGNRYTELLKLTRSGIRQISLKEPSVSMKILPVIKGAPLISRSGLPDQALYWTFDNGLSEQRFSRRDVTEELSTGTLHETMSIYEGLNSN